MTRPSSEAEVLALAKQLGWRARRTRCGWWLTHPDGGMTSFHGGRVSDKRAWRNMTARLYRTASR